MQIKRELYLFFCPILEDGGFLYINKAIFFLLGALKKKKNQVIRSF